MRSITVKNLTKIKKATPVIESKIKIRISFGKGKRLTIRGNAPNEFLVEKIIRAIDFGFDVEDTILLKNENYVLEFIDLKNHTHRKNLTDVRARLIGTRGKAKRTIENLTGSIMVIHGNKIAVIVDTKHLDITCNAIVSIIQGSKHGNVFSYLEKQGKRRRMFDEEDLGLKENFKDQKNNEA